MSEEEDLVGELFGWVGTAISFYFYLAPVVPFMKVLREEISYKDSPGILLISSFLNCILWADYGLLLDRAQIYFANGIGGVITLVWITIFIIFFCGKRFILSLLANLGLMLIIAGIALLCFFIVPPEYTGDAAMVFNIVMYAAPGEKIVRVFKTGNYQLIPIFSSIGGFACSMSWFMYGVYLWDKNILIPNALGLFFAVLQLIAYIWFYCKDRNRRDSNNNEPGEMPNSSANEQNDLKE